jgi:hypothetical protein
MSQSHQSPDFKYVVILKVATITFVIGPFEESNSCNEYLTTLKLALEKIKAQFLPEQPYLRKFSDDFKSILKENRVHWIQPCGTIAMDISAIFNKFLTITLH